MNTEVIELKKLKCHKANPRLIKDYKFQSLINSLLVFPEMLELRPIVVDGSMQALGGNMRTKALLSISQMNDSEIAGRLNSLDGYKGKTAEQQSNLIQYWKVWRDKPIAHIVRADSLTDDQKREFIIKDNSSFGEWDMDALANEWNLDELNEWGLELNFGADDLSAEDDEEEIEEDDETSYIVEIVCDNEAEQQEAFKKVGDLGFVCRMKFK